MPEIAGQAGLTGAQISYAGDTALAADTVSDIHRNMGRVAAVVLVVNLSAADCVSAQPDGAPVLARLERVRGGGVTGRNHVGVSVVARLRAAHLLRPVRGLGAPDLAGIGLQHLRGGPDLAGGEPAAAARGRGDRRARGSRAISAAGITLAGSFAIIAIIPVRSFREIAFAMVTGILIETFVVRSLLAPVADHDCSDTRAAGPGTVSTQALTHRSIRSAATDPPSPKKRESDRPSRRTVQLSQGRGGRTCPTTDQERATPVLPSRRSRLEIRYRVAPNRREQSKIRRQLTATRHDRG